MKDLNDPGLPAIERSEAARWLACFVAVVATHCAFAIAVFAKWENAAPGAPPSVMIELAAFPVAPPTQPSEALPGPEATASESQAEPEEKPQETVAPPIEQKAEVEPKVEPDPILAKEPEPEPVEQAELKADISSPPMPEPVQIPELRPAQKPEVAIAVPAPSKEKNGRQKSRLKRSRHRRRKNRVRVPHPATLRHRPRRPPPGKRPRSPLRAATRRCLIGAIGLSRISNATSVFPPACGRAEPHPCASLSTAAAAYYRAGCREVRARGRLILKP